MTVTQTFNYTGTEQSWVVPAGVVGGSVVVECWGAQGGPSPSSAGVPSEPGGTGGYAKGNLAVTAGETLSVWVGGAGQQPETSRTSGVPGGFNGGGLGGYNTGYTRCGGSGGGASDVRQGGSLLNYRKIVGGGGGGRGGRTGTNYTNYYPGTGGGSFGGNSPTPSGGQGGVQVAGGAAGTTAGSGRTAGVAGSGGNGGNAGGSDYAAGGGGGGLYGGGGGTIEINTTGSGGGGSGYTGGVTLASMINGVWSAYGQVVITYTLNAAPNAPTPTSPANNAAIDLTILQRFAWVFSDPDAGNTQTKFDLIYRLVGASTWTTITQTTANQFYDFAANTFATGNYEWQVRTYDNSNVVGPYSASRLFTASNSGFLMFF